MLNPCLMGHGSSFNTLSGSNRVEAPRWAAADAVLSGFNTLSGSNRVEAWQQWLDRMVIL